MSPVAVRHAGITQQRTLRPWASQAFNINENFQLLSGKLNKYWISVSENSSKKHTNFKNENISALSVVPRCFKTPVQKPATTTTGNESLLPTLYWILKTPMCLWWSKLVTQSSLPDTPNTKHFQLHAQFCLLAQDLWGNLMWDFTLPAWNEL